MLNYPQFVVVSLRSPVRPLAANLAMTHLLVDKTHTDLFHLVRVRSAVKVPAVATNF